MVATGSFVGRTVDQLIFQGVKPVGDAPVRTGWGESGALCTGIQKVAQTWTIIFLTERNTVLNDPERGTDFLRAMRTGRISIEEDVPTEFGLASERVKRIMDLDALDQGLPDDERLAGATLIDHRIDRLIASLFMRVGVVSIAGDSREIILPTTAVIK